MGIRQHLVHESVSAAVRASQVKPSPVKSSQVKPSQVKSRQCAAQAAWAAHRHYLAVMVAARARGPSHVRAATCTRPEEWFCTPAVALVVPLVHAEAAECAEAAGSTDAAPRATSVLVLGNRYCVCSGLDCCEGRRL